MNEINQQVALSFWVERVESNQKPNIHYYDLNFGKRWCNYVNREKNSKAKQYLYNF